MEHQDKNQYKYPKKKMQHFLYFYSSTGVKLTKKVTVINGQNTTTTPVTGPDGFNYMNAATNTSLTRSDFDGRFLDVQPGRRHVPDPVSEHPDLVLPPSVHCFTRQVNFN